MSCQATSGHACLMYCTSWDHFAKQRNSLAVPHIRPLAFAFSPFEASKIFWRSKHTMKSSVFTKLKIFLLDPFNHYFKEDDEQARLMKVSFQRCRRYRYSSLRDRMTNCVRTHFTSRRFRIFERFPIEENALSEKVPHQVYVDWWFDVINCISRLSSLKSFHQQMWLKMRTWNLGIVFRYATMEKTCETNSVESFFHELSYSYSSFYLDSRLLRSDWVRRFDQWRESEDRERFETATHGQ